MATCLRLYNTLIVLIVAIWYQCVSVAGTDSDKRFLVDVNSTHWSEWSTYGSCSVTCGVGVKTRQRQCSGGASFPVAQTCNGKSSETAECSLRSCSSLSYCNLGPIGQHTITASSETRAHPASGVFTDKGWCAANKQNNEWLEVDFPNGFGVKRFNISSIHALNKSGAYPKSVLVQYAPEYGQNLIDFPLQSGPLVIELNQTGSSAVTIPGFPVKKLRLTLKEFVGDPCMKLEISGCSLKDLCTPSCVNGGICDYENHCSCMNGFHGDTCEMIPAKSTTTSTSTKISTTPTTTTTTPKPPTTPQPIPAFHWNLTTIPNSNSNVVIGQKFNLTIHGTPIKTNTGMVFKNTTQFIDLGQIKCLLDPLNCVQGLTVQFMINVKVTSENTYLLTSGGELPNGIGIAVIYRYGQYQFVLTTTTKSWYANCGKDILTPHKFHLVMITWKENIGLEIIVDNKQVEIVNTAVNHQVSFTSSAIVYFGKQPPYTVKCEYVLQTVSIWYAHVDILVIEGLCPKPDRPVTINGGWSDWNGWTTCSVTCNTGVQSRERTCTNPAPSNGGVGCPGYMRESMVCTAGPCAGWTHWFDGTCSASCGQGQRERLRHCSTGHDNDCPGDAYEIVTCYGDNC